MKKGFTLIELVGVIVIIGLMVTIIVPIVNSALKKGKEKADEQTKESITLAAQNWAIENKDRITRTCNISLADLQNGGFLDEDIETTLQDGTSIIGSCVRITPETKNGTKTTYSYAYQSNCSTTCN